MALARRPRANSGLQPRNLDVPKHDAQNKNNSASAQKDDLTKITDDAGSLETKRVCLGASCRRPQAERFGFRSPGWNFVRISCQAFRPSRIRKVAEQLGCSEFKPS